MIVSRTEMEGRKSDAVNHHLRQLSVAKQVGDKAEEGRAFKNLCIAYQSIGDFKQAIRYHMLYLTISKKVRDRAREGGAYGNLGIAYKNIGDFKQAIEYHMLHLTISKEVGDRAGEGRAYGNLGIAYNSLGDFKQAIEDHMLHLTISKEVEDKAGEGHAYGNLGIAYDSLGDFKQAIEYHMLRLSIAKEVGDRAGEGGAYGNLGNAYQGLGDFKQAIEYHMLCLTIAKELGGRAGEGAAYLNLARSYLNLCDYRKATEHCKKCLDIAKLAGDKGLEQSAYDVFGCIRLRLGDLEGSVEHCHKCLTIAEEIGDKIGVGYASCKLGTAYRRMGNIEVGIEYHKRHLNIAKEIGDRCGEACACYGLGGDYERSGCFHEALDCFRSSVKVYDYVRGLQIEDNFKLSFRDMHQTAYTALCTTLVRLSKTDEALCAAEQGRAQALLDLMKLRFGLQSPSSEIPDSREVISGVVSFLSTKAVFVSLDHNRINLWTLSKGNNVHFRQTLVEKGNAVNFVERLRKDCLKENHIRGRCVNELREKLPVRREPDEMGQSSHCATSSLRLLYYCTFGPIESVLDGDEVLIIPDGPLWLAPFAAFVDEAGCYLSESTRIRLIPSLTSLKLLKDCSKCYHSTTGALLVGDPCLKEVTNIFGKPILPQLPHSIEEVKMIGEILNTTPLTGREATKEEVLKRITSVALVSK